jgi:Uma2 family endonuclease
MTPATATAKPIVYPDSDGKPMAENTLQFQWIVTIQGGLDAVFAKDPNVFVAGDLLWYPVKGEPKIRQAPDTLVAFGRPKGYRGSYRQWEEGGIAPKVVFEVLSPGNRRAEMSRKFDFYEKYGVDEYYVFDPETIELLGWTRQGDKLCPIASMQGWTSPLLKIRFELGEDLTIYGPDQRPFATYIEVVQQRADAEHAAYDAQRLAQDAQRAAQDAQRATQDAQRAAQNAQLRAQDAQLQAQNALLQADAQARTAERLRAQLKAAGIDPEA